jgi:iron complex outermembrane recepter protein
MNTKISAAVRAAMPVLATSVLAFSTMAAIAADATDEELQEVVVTAQFREQRLQDTPIAITAVNAEQMEARNQTNLAAVAAQAPNVVLRETGGAFGPGLSANIRGVGQGDYIAALEPGVGIYIDDVYYSSLTGANFDLIDLERVEIQRGPQGVLGGRNSEGGAVKLFSQKPRGDGTGSLRATYGSRDLLDIRAAADFALVADKLYARISGTSHAQDGYVTIRDYGCDFPTSGIPIRTQHADCVMGHEGGKDYTAGRAALRWLASDNVEVNFSGDLMVDNSEVAPTVLIGTAPVNPANIGDIPWGTGTQYIPASRHVTYATFSNQRPDGSIMYFAPVTDTTVWGTNLSVDWTLNDSLALKSITAYREFDSRWVEDNDTTPAYIGLGAEHQSNESFSQELRLNGKAGDAFDYTLGGYYFDQTTIGRTHQVLNYVGTPFLFEFLGNDPTDASSYAAFANGSWHATDALNVNAGLRYTKEKKDYTYSRQNPDGTPNAVLGALEGVTGSYSGSKVDYRINVDYRWNEALMTYGGVSTGFKGGGVNPRPFNAGQVASFDPEKLTAFEVGAKTDLLDRKLRVNVSAFLNKYKDIQVGLLECPGQPGAPCALPANVGNADIKGIEAEILAYPVAGLQLEASISTQKFEYTSFTANTGIPEGASAPNTVEDKFSIGAQWEFGLASGATITPRVDFSYQGGFNTNAVPSTYDRVNGRHLANARLTWKSAAGDWQVALIGSNLADEYYYTSKFDLTPPNLGGGAAYGIVAPPREYSVQVQKKF